MGYCKSCLKAKEEVPESEAEKARLWFMRNICQKELTDYRHDFYTQGVAKGYEMGFEEGVDYICTKNKEMSREDIEHLAFKKINASTYEKFDKEIDRK